MVKEKAKKARVHKGFVNYAVGDFLIRFKNAAKAGKKTITAPRTKLTLAVSEVLKSEGYVSEIVKTEDKITLTFARFAKEPVLMGLKLVSRPGLRQYIKFDELYVKRGPEIYILSTPKGVMSSKQAIKKVVGGEIIAKIW